MYIQYTYHNIVRYLNLKINQIDHENKTKYLNFRFYIFKNKYLFYKRITNKL